MRLQNLKRSLLVLAVLFATPMLLTAQEAPVGDQPAVSAKDIIKTYLQYYDSIQYFNYYDQRGINTFETPKVQGTNYYGFRLRIGAGFTQQFQNLKHENKTAINNTTTNRLYPLQSGFMTAQANLFTDVQLADGIRLNLTTYLSSRHHNEAWVKGGYIQFDKLPFKGQFWDKLMSMATIKVGHMEVNYGDAHFRRPDGGQTILAPFMEGNIMDAFATEIGGEIYLRKGAFFGMVGVTNGMIKGNVDSTYETVADKDTKRAPSFYFKGGIDQSFAPRIRVRASASLYSNSSNAGSGLTLFGGDRTGSNYQNVMEKAPAGAALPASTAIAFSGRFNPGFSKQITATMLNGFVKFQGLEVFGTLEKAVGRTKNEAKSRNANQFAVEGLYRVGKGEKVYVGARYNTVNARLAGFAEDVSVQRTSFVAGWFVTRNIMMKAEYVNQKYKDYPTTDYRSGGNFKGYVVEAIVGF